MLAGCREHVEILSCSLPASRKQALVVKSYSTSPDQCCCGKKKAKVSVSGMVFGREWLRGDKQAMISALENKTKNRRKVISSLTPKS